MLEFFKNKIKKIKEGFAHFKFSIASKIKNILGKGRNEETYEELEKLFYESDLGVKMATALTDFVKVLEAKQPGISSEEILKELEKKAFSYFPKEQMIEELFPLHVILIVGINGSGKTTSVAKLAKFYKGQGKKVLIAAGDTFRSAAVEQLEKWAEEIDVDIVKAQSGSDPAAVAFDALSAAKARKTEVVIIDTAGRLETKTELLSELEKIKRVIAKQVEKAPHEILLTLDATIGQNALEQVKLFSKYTPLTGIILTKMDGTAKGGIALAIQSEFSVPVKWIGAGESAEDLTLFDPKLFIKNIFSI